VSLNPDSAIRGNVHRDNLNPASSDRVNRCPANSLRWISNPDNNSPEPDVARNSVPVRIRIRIRTRILVKNRCPARNRIREYNLPESRIRHRISRINPASDRDNNPVNKRTGSPVNPPVSNNREVVSREANNLANSNRESVSRGDVNKAARILVDRGKGASNPVTLTNKQPR